MISIIVCAYNQSQCLKRVLESFFKQEGLDKIEFELIIVDNNSDDDTSSVVEGLRDQSKLRYVFKKNRFEWCPKPWYKEQSRGNSCLHRRRCDCGCLLAP